MDASAAAAAAPKEEDEDFFESWSKPTTPKPSNPGTPRTGTPPVLGKATSSASSTASSSSAPASTGPRTISSSSIRPGRPGAGATRLTSGSSTTAAKKSKLGLGATKAKPVDFEEAERKALAEAERIKQLGYNREREAAEEKARKEAEATKLAKNLSNLSVSSSTPAASTPTARKGPDPKASAAFPRLGFGAVPGAGAAAAVASSSPTTSRAPVVDDAPTTAREKFGGQKAISSDMYFGRGTYDPQAQSEAQQRLQPFQGATSISSSAYFGRDDEEEDALRSQEGLLGDGSLAGLENAAKDAISRVLSNPDVQNAAESLRTGALKVWRFPIC